MKKVIILHGWTNGDISSFPEYLPDSEANWMGWIKRKLENLSYEAHTPFIKNGYKADYKEWKKQIEPLKIDEDTILVGWSSGGAFWVRWLSETKQHVKKLILIAPAKVVGNTKKAKKEIASLDINPKWRNIWDEFHNFECDANIKNRVEEIIIFISNDADWLVDASKLYAEELDATLIKIDNQGHFENQKRPSPAFPELLEVIVN